MSKRLLGFVLLIGVGSVAMIGYYFAKPYLDTERNRFTSDASGTKGHIIIGVDNWIGYFPLCSKQMKSLMRSAGYLLECQDDSADYAARMKALRQGKLNFAVATIDSYLLNGPSADFPGTIVAVIDESKGGDALIANKSHLSNLEDLKKKNQYKIAYTPASPSEHLLKSISVHFDVPRLRSKSGDWSVHTDGSTEALEKLTDGKVDAAVLWEPDVSKALSNPNFEKLLGTEDTEKLIVDILLVERDFSKVNPQVVGLLLSNYFRSLKHYQNNQKDLVEEVKEKTGISEKRVNAMLDGVRWVNLFDNAMNWFGISSSTSAGGTREGVIETIESTSQILVDVGDFSSSPIPQNNPYFLQNKKFVEDLFNSGLKSQFGVSNQPDIQTLTKEFSSLTGVQWQNLRQIGTLKIRPITFQSGTANLDTSGASQLSMAAKNLEHYPNFRVAIKGHTGLRGDPTANRKLSQQRADAVLNYLVKSFSIDKNRLRAYGMGSSEPLPKPAGEPDRSYNYRLPRVELILVSEVY